LYVYPAGEKIETCQYKTAEFGVHPSCSGEACPKYHDFKWNWGKIK